MISIENKEIQPNKFEEMSDAIETQEKAQDKLQPAINIDFLKYFSNNGFKECQYLENKNIEKKEKAPISIKAYDKKSKKQVIIRVIKSLQALETCQKINEIQSISSKFIQKYLYPAQIIQDNYIYYVKEFQKNGNLKEQLKKKMFNIDYAQRFVSKMLIGIDSMHKKNLFHGRIKLENVITDSNNQVLLSDYGIQEDDGFFFEETKIEEEKQDEEVKEIEIEGQVKVSKQQDYIMKMQRNDLFRMGIAIICICDALKEKEKDFIEIVRYNTKRSHKLIYYANMMMGKNGLESFRLSDILEQLNYFEGTYQTFYLGVQKYEGEIKDNKKHGRGVCEYIYGDVVFGTWKNDKYQNDGVIYYSYADVVDRGFSEEERKNSVEIWTKEQAIFEGTLEDTWMNGTGKYTRNNIVQVGTFKRGHLNGYCEIFYATHDIFKGNLVNHKKTGYGEIFWDCKQTYKGDFHQDQVSGIGEYFFADGSEYYGETKNSYFEGFGKLYWNYGYYYEGNWVKHEKNGYGKYFYTGIDGTYEGMFLANQMHGEGRLTRLDGTVKYGIWDNGIYKEGSDKLVNPDQLNRKFQALRDAQLNKSQNKNKQCSIF